jgi:uncharacterized membrane protein YphA (DoxX/SURF4 family)
VIWTSCFPSCFNSVTRLAVPASHGAAVFFTSGLGHVRDPVGRAASIGLSPGFTRFLGWGEMAAALGVAFGVFAQIAALGLMVIMSGSIQKKVFVWHTGGPG